MRHAAVQRRCVPPRQRAGLTLLEVLVVLGVVAILTAITLTALRGARGRAEQATLESDLRSAGQLHAAWRNEHQSRFLNVGEHDEHFVRSGRLAEGSLIVYLESLEGRLLHIPYPQQAASDAWMAVMEKWHGERLRFGAPMLYGFGFFTDPALWAEGSEPWTRWPATEMFRFVREAETAFPSAKALLTHLHETPGRSGPTEAPSASVSLVDGSVHTAPVEDFLPQCGGFFAGAPAAQVIPGAYTIDGVRGRDVAR